MIGPVTYGQRSRTAAMAIAALPEAVELNSKGAAEGDRMNGWGIYAESFRVAGGSPGWQVTGWGYVSAGDWECGLERRRWQSPPYPRQWD